MSTAGVVTARFPIPTENADPLSLAVTSHGLYIAESSAGALVPMSLDGAFGRPVQTKSTPDAITVGPDGALWYAAGNEGKVGRLDIGG